MLAIVSFGAGFLGIPSFFLMFNWAYGEYLIAPTLVFAVTSLVSGFIFLRKMKSSGEKLITNTKIYLAAFGILIGACILLWFLLAIFIHYEFFGMYRDA